ncbi:hypothetical protein [Xanthomonas phage pXoo2107]|nr:hypothetical protein [Xanthomonas phage pXoo2107]
MNDTQQPKMMSVAAAVDALRSLRPDLPPITQAQLQKLGKDCTLYSRIKDLPLGAVTVYGKDWNTERTYTYDAIREVFLLNPATRDYVPKL